MENQPVPLRQLAVALQYEPQMDNAPRVVAKGRGVVAEKLLNVAREHNVPIQQDEHLAQTLSHIDLGQHIPEELYTAVAEVLAFVFQMNQTHTTNR